MEQIDAFNVRLEKMEIRNLIRKLVVSIQDVNADEMLEKKFKEKNMDDIVKLLQSILDLSVNTQKYISKYDTEETKQYKKVLLLEKLKIAVNIVAVYDMVEKELMEALIDYLSEQNYQTRQIQQEGLVKLWWITE